MNKVIISLIGVKQSGKTTASQIIQELLPDANNIAIADKLKVVCSDAFDLDLIHFHSQDLKEESLIYPIRLTMEGLSVILENFKVDKKPVNVSSEAILELATMKMRTPRHMLQNVGMFVREVFGKQVHMKHLDLSSDLTIVSDVRMVSEFNYLNSLEGYTHIPIYVENKSAESVNDLHVSEKEYLKFKNKCTRLDNNIKDIDILVDNIEDILFKHKDVLF